MPHHDETRFLPYTAEQMYDLVADVARYPEFLPWTAAARVREVRQEGEGQVMLADMVIAFKVFRERYLSRVTLTREPMRIDSAFVEGPFRALHSVWTFAPADGGCEVSFTVDFEFRSRILQTAATVFFNEAMQRIVRAFESRARELYG